MTYELAEELRDKGFPQNTKWFSVKVGDEEPIVLLEQEHYGGALFFSNPTLSELIEECRWHMPTLEATNGDAAKAEPKL
jgi:hypothetical protein